MWDTGNLRAGGSVWSGGSLWEGGGARAGESVRDGGGARAGGTVWDGGNTRAVGGVAGDESSRGDGSVPTGGSERTDHSARAGGNGWADGSARAGGSVRAGGSARAGESDRVDDSAPGAGSVRAGGSVWAGGITASYAHAEHSGDAFGWARSGSRVTLLLADGLGHGEKAAEASTVAVEELHRGADLPPADLLRRLHSALRRTRGAAVGVAQLDQDSGTLSFAGVGNIGARLRTGTGWQPFISHPGIVGAHFPATVPLRRADWHPDSLLVLHSDGLPSRWVPPLDPLLLTHDPAVVAAVVLRDSGSAARPLRDDTSVAVLTPAADGSP
ncbi:SpoIIE family protein phosphatase [Streptomyces sp. NPDC057253]|uniref:SpoIIE family protein phosphatase n=1 Tax=Streptomyces sp. NPDC057253 TaxID=3346069 RepID=UPI0036425787